MRSTMLNTPLMRLHGNHFLGKPAFKVRPGETLNPKLGSYKLTLEAQLPTYWVPVLKSLYNFMVSVTQEPGTWASRVTELKPACSSGASMFQATLLLSAAFGLSGPPNAVKANSKVTFLHP